MDIELFDQQQTEDLGAALWLSLPQKCLLFLVGDLGAGKTTLMRGMLRAAGYQGAVKSPTYSLVEEYEVDGRRVFHFDLYRLKDPEELEWMGMTDYLAQSALCCVEWPQMGEGLLPEADLVLTLSINGQGRLAKLKIVNPVLIGRVKLNWKNNDLLL